MVTDKFKVLDVKSFDEGRGVSILVSQSPLKIVSLVFDKSVPHQQTSDLARTLALMKLTEITVETS
jgi:hypothetical protein